MSDPIMIRMGGYGPPTTTFSRALTAIGDRLKAELGERVDVKYHTVSNHFYLSRPIFLHRPSFDAWPDDVQAAMRSAVTEAVAMQRDMAVAEEEAARRAILDAGCEIITLSSEEQEAFAAAVEPVYKDPRWPRPN